MVAVDKLKHLSVVGCYVAIAVIHCYRCKSLLMNTVIGVGVVSFVALVAFLLVRVVVFSQYFGDLHLLYKKNVTKYVCYVHA